MADWTYLPDGLLDLIAQHIHQIKDMVVIDSICKSWRSTLSFESPHFPLLMLAEQHAIGEEEDAIRRTRCLFDLFNSNIYEVDLPEACDRVCMGTGFGWMLTIGFDLKINLLHPFTRNQISLPHQSMFPHPFHFGETANPYDMPEPTDRDQLILCVKKAVLSSSPQHQQDACVVMVIYGIMSLLAFARLGSKDILWIDVATPSRCYDDLVYYKEQFYAVGCHGNVVVCDINYDGNSKATVIAPLPAGLMDHDKKYLVESSGDLLLISRIYGGPNYENESEAEENEDVFEAKENEDGFETDENKGKSEVGENEDESEVGENDDEPEVEENEGEPEEEENEGEPEAEEFELVELEDDLRDMRDVYQTIGFLIFRMEQRGDGTHKYPNRWVKVNNLGNRVLFLGNNSSVSLPASSNLKANCIYFTDDHEWISLGRNGGGHDMGIFNMEDATIERHYPDTIHSKFCSSFWYI